MKFELINCEKKIAGTNKAYEVVKAEWDKFNKDVFDKWVPLRDSKKYIVNPWLGVIKNIKGGKVLNGTLGEGGYRLVCIDGNKSWCLHRLIWFHCNGEIPSKMTINHIDHNTSNNSICNLELTSQSENNKKRRPYKKLKAAIPETDLSGYEPLRGYDDYLINPIKGNVIHKKKQCILGGIKATGYVGVGFFRNKKVEFWYLHRLVYYHVNGPIPNEHEIDHINGDKLNNAISNLQCLSKADHAKKTGLTTRRANLLNKENDLEEFNLEGVMQYIEDEDLADDGIEEFNIEDEDLADDCIEEFNLEGVIQHLEDEGYNYIAVGLMQHLY